MNQDEIEKFIEELKVQRRATKNRWFHPKKITSNRPIKQWNVVNSDFTSLYPSTMTVLLGGEEYKRIKLNKERKEKLEKLNSL